MVTKYTGKIINNAEKQHEILMIQSWVKKCREIVLKSIHIVLGTEQLKKL